MELRVPRDCRWAFAVCALVVAVAALALFSPLVAVSFAVLFTAVVLACALPPRMTLLAGLTLAPLSVPVTLADRSVLLPPTDFVIIPLAVVVALSALTGRARPRLLAADIYFFGFLLFAVLSMPASERLTSYAFALKSELVAYLTFRLTLASFDRPGQIRESFAAMLLVLAVLLVSFFTSFAAAYREGGIEAVIWERAGQNPVGAAWGVANTFAAHLALVLPPVAGLALMKGAGLVRLGAGVALLVGLAAVVMSVSRGAMLAVLIAALVFVWINRRRARVLLVTAAVVAGAGLAFVGSSQLGSRAVERFAAVGSDLSSQARIAVWKAHLAAIAERPLIGHGLDNVGLPFSMSTLRGRADAHNFFLKTAAQVGLVGLAFKLALLGVFLRTLWRQRSRSASAPVLYATFAAVFAGTLANSMVESVFSGDRYSLIFMHLMGLLMVWERWLNYSTAAGPAEPSHGTGTR